MFNALDCAIARAEYLRQAAPRWAWLGGGCAVDAGAGTHLTQASGLGVLGGIHPADVAQLEAFYETHSAVLNVPALVTPALRQLVVSGYACTGEMSILVRNLPAAVERTVLPVDRVNYDTRAAFIDVVGRGFRQQEAGEVIARVPEASLYVARYGTRPAGGAALATHGGVALLFGDATAPGFRQRGVHTALIRARLREAAMLGCDMATATTIPGSASERNYLRHGFVRLYERLTFERAARS